MEHLHSFVRFLSTVRFRTVGLALCLLLLPFISLSCAKNAKKDYLRGIEDLHGKNVAVVIGSTHDAYMSRNHPQCQLLHCENKTNLALALSVGQVEAVVNDHVWLRYTHEQGYSFQSLGDPLFHENFGMGFDDPQLRDRFNQFLAQLRGSGEYDKICAIWEGEEEYRQLPVMDFPAPKGDLNVACYMGPYFAYMKDNRVQGLEIHLISLFCLQEGYRPVFTVMDFSAILASLASHKSDVICGSITITPERSNKINFSDPVYTVHCYLVVHKDRLAPEQRKEHIAVLLNSSQDAYAERAYPQADILRFNSVESIFTALRKGYADKAVMSDPVAEEMMRSRPELVCLSPAVATDTVVYAFSKGRKDLLSRFNAFVGRMKASGALDSILHRWTTDPEARIPDMDYSAARGVLRVASDIEPYPFCFVKDNVTAGALPELICLFAARENLKPEFDFYEFSALLNAVDSGKADMTSCFLMYTAERAQSLCMSDAVYHVDMGIYGLREEVAPRKTFWTALSQSFHNNLIKEQRYLLILQGLKETLLIAFFALILGTVLGMGVCWLRMRPEAWVSGFARAYIGFMQGIPQVVLLMIMFYVVFASTSLTGITVAVITFALNFAAYVSEIFRTSIMSIDRGQTEAGISLGFTRTKTFFQFVAPQALRRVMPLYKAETISLVKMTSIVGYIAVQDLTKASDIIRSRTFDAFFPLIFISVIYFILAWLLAKCVEWGQNALMRQHL